MNRMRRVLRCSGRRGLRTLGMVALAGVVVLGGTGLGAVRTADAALERTLTVAHEDTTWQTTPGELGAHVSAQQLVSSVDWLDDLEAAQLAAALSTGDRDHGAPTLPAQAPEDRLADWVGEIAEEVDEPARDAGIESVELASAQELEFREARDGVEVDREAAVEALRDALRAGEETVRLPVAEVEPELATDDVASVLPELRAAVSDALDGPVTVVHDDRRWEVTPAELDATVHLDAEDGAALRAVADGQAPESAVGVAVSAGEVEAFVERVAAEVERAPRDARLDGSGGSLEIVPHRDGVRIDREEAAQRLQQALEGAREGAREEGGASIELPVARTAPAVTAGDYDRVLYLRQDERRLYLYVDGQPVRDWPVAVGQAGHATPTGQFTVGAKRHRPTWVNPSPDGWGSDMPDRVGPGSDNPLGVRALNWNQHGRDTLIRFHGTPDEDSIGEAASRGCVRLTNEDVRELYDLVPSGTPIVSVR